MLLPFFGTFSNPPAFVAAIYIILKRANKCLLPHVLTQLTRIFPNIILADDFSGKRTTWPCASIDQRDIEIRGCANRNSAEIIEPSEPISLKSEKKIDFFCHPLLSFPVQRSIAKQDHLLVVLTISDLTIFMRLRLSQQTATAGVVRQEQLLWIRTLMSNQRYMALEIVSEDRSTKLRYLGGIQSAVLDCLSSSGI